MLKHRTVIPILYIVCLIVICQVSKAFRSIPLYNTKSLMFSHKMDHRPSSPQPRRPGKYQYSNKSHNKAPIYITIGPQCAGKTSFLQKLHNTEASSLENPIIAKHHLHTTPICDITIDDQPGVYLPLPKELFLVNTHDPNSSHQELLTRKIHDKSIAERIYDASTDEQRYILQRLHNAITANEFAERILSIKVDAYTHNIWKQYMENSNCNHSDYRHFLIHVVEKTLERHGPPCIDTVDLFIVESIFRNQDDGLFSFLSEQSNHKDRTIPPSMDDSSFSGLSAAVQNLKHVACHPNKMNVPLAWGNTNTKSRDYVNALEAAEMSGRPVYFVPYMDVKKNMVHDGLILPKVGVVSLLERNIGRLVSTGRYIPSRAIIDASNRVDQMMNRAMNDLRSVNASGDTKRFTQVELDMVLTRHAGDFRMNRHNRTIYRIPQKPNERWGDGNRRGVKRYHDRNTIHRNHNTRQGRMNTSDRRFT